MLSQRMMLLLALLALLAGCGASSATTGRGTSSGSAPTATAPAAGPETTVNQALDALAARDEAALTDMFDTSVGNRSVHAFEAVRDWIALQSDAKVPGALGSVKHRQLQLAEAHGQTTVVPVIVTHERGTARWEFSLRQIDQGWRLVNIHGQMMEQP